MESEALQLPAFPRASWHLVQVSGVTWADSGGSMETRLDSQGTVPRSTVLGVAKRGARWPSGAQGEEPCSVAPGRPDELESFRGGAGPVALRSPLPRVPVLTRLLGGHDAPLPPVMLEMEEGPF